MSLGAATIVEILKLGLSGFAFLMMWFSYRLLKAEQEREGDPRPRIIRATYVFMAVSFAFSLLVASNAAFGLLRESDHTQLEGQVAQCRDGLDVLQSISQLEGQSVGDLRAAIDRTVALCDPLLLGLDSESAGEN